MSVGIHPWGVKPTTLASRVVPRKTLPAPGSRGLGIADGGEEVFIPKVGLITPLPIAAGAPAIQAGTPGRLPGIPGRPRGPVAAQQPQPAQSPQQEAEQEDEDIDGSDSDSTDNRKRLIQIVHKWEKLLHILQILRMMNSRKLNLWMIACLLRNCI